MEMLNEEREAVTKEIARANLLTRLGHLQGAAIFVALWYIFYQYVLIQTLPPWLAFVGAMILAAIFGYLADFHGYKRLVAKLIGRSLKQERKTA